MGKSQNLSAQDRAEAMDPSDPWFPLLSNEDGVHSGVRWMETAVRDPGGDWTSATWSVGLYFMWELVRNAGCRPPGTCWTRSRVGTRNLYFTSFSRDSDARSGVRTSGLGQRRGNFSVKGQVVHIKGSVGPNDSTLPSEQESIPRQYELHGRGCVPIKLY